MRPAIVKTIALKELRESFRDRRTLLLMILLPLLLYPLLMLTVAQIAASQQTRLERIDSRIGILGAGLDHPLARAIDASDGTLLAEVGASEGSGAGDLDRLGLDALVDLRNLPAVESLDQTGRVTVFYQSVREGSRQALDRVLPALQNHRSEVLTRRIAEQKLPAAFAQPFDWSTTDRNAPEQRGGFLLGTLLPFLVIINVLLGAYYPAIDLTAGERERGSIQTLFTAPVAPTELVAGKYLAVVCIALLSGSMNLLSLSLLFGQNLLIQPGMLGAIDMSLPWHAIGLLAWVVLLLAFFVSALLLTVAVMARSFKEAQTFITPVYLLCIVPAMIAQLPGFHYSTALGLVPGVNVVLLMKAALVSGASADAVFVVSAATAAYTAAILAVAARIFASEGVALGDRPAIALLQRRSELEATPTPGFAEAMTWFGIMLVVLFYAGATLQAKVPRVGLAVTLWGFVLLPTLLVTLYIRADFRQTYLLRRPRLRDLVAAALLGCSVWLGVLAVQQFLDAHVLSMPKEMAAEMAKFFPRPESPFDWAMMLLLGAVSPAICEEVLFRGFILQGLRTRLRDGAAVVVSALLFGVFHLSLTRLPATMLLGLVLGWLAVRSRSIVPSMCFHAVNNGVVLIAGYTVSEAVAAELPGWVPVAALLSAAIGAALVWPGRVRASSGPTA
jgi:sodium transport system permease protein